MMINKDYFSFIIQTVKNKNVLDIGSIGHDFGDRDVKRVWNFGVIKKHAKSLLGIDHLKNEVKKAQLEGYNIIYQDAEKYISRKKFDMVYAGDVIEHLSNPGKFLECAYKNLKKNGRVVILTPNTFSSSRIFRVFTKFTNDPPVNREHTVYFTPQLITELLNRYKFRVVEIEYLHFPFSNLSFLIVMNYLICKIIGKKYRETMVVIAEKK